MRTKEMKPWISLVFHYGLGRYQVSSLGDFLFFFFLGCVSKGSGSLVLACVLFLGGVSYLIFFFFTYPEPLFFNTTGCYSYAYTPIHPSIHLSVQHVSPSRQLCRHGQR
ncbi:hypothetical protein F4775DRAFT_552426 [Biscogniauxia sp. FL1348]|nr:hypothetical protein F4775DRAFT_552426 [Biscogniauxia sp. FL1348]